MSDLQPGANGDDPFETVDARLTIFALANGMDRTMGSGFRRFEWFARGLERGILIEAEPGGAFRMHVLSWPTQSSEVRTRTSVGEGLTAEDVVGLLPSAIEAANAL